MSDNKIIAAIWIVEVFIILSVMSAVSMLPTQAQTEESIPTEAKKTATVIEYKDEPLPPTVWEETEGAEETVIEIEPEPFPWRRDDVPLSVELQDVLYKACEAAGIDYALGLGLIDGESTFRENAVSKSGCYGLCQLNPRYFPADLSPADNIRTGIAFLASQIERYSGDIDAGLTAYNVGHDNGSRGYAEYIREKAEKWRAE